MIACKFLRPGAVGPFSGVAWHQPAGGRPGDWVGDGTLTPCVAGVHACRPEELPYWIQAELWLVQLDGEVTERPLKLVAPRGRLVERVSGWDRDAMADFAKACALRLGEQAMAAADGADGARGLIADYATAVVGFAEETARSDDPAGLAAVTAIASVRAAAVAAAGPGARVVSELDPDHVRTVEARERDWQAAWMRARLALG